MRSTGRAVVVLAACAGAWAQNQSIIGWTRQAQDPTANGFTLNVSAGASPTVAAAGSSGWGMTTSDPATQAFYYHPMTSQQLSNAATYGWLARCGVSVVNASTSFRGECRFDTGTLRFDWGLYADSQGKRIAYVVNSGGILASSTITAFSQTNDNGYYIDLRYDPATATANLYVGLQPYSGPLMAGYTGRNDVAFHPGFSFGITNGTGLAEFWNVWAKLDNETLIFSDEGPDHLISAMVAKGWGTQSLSYLFYGIDADASPSISGILPAASTLPVPLDYFLVFCPGSTAVVQTKLQSIVGSTVAVNSDCTVDTVDYTSGSFAELNGAASETISVNGVEMSMVYANNFLAPLATFGTPPHQVEALFWTLGASSNTYQTIVLSNEGTNGLVSQLFAAGYGNFNIYQLLLTMASNADPSIAGIVTPSFVQTLGNLPPTAPSSAAGSRVRPARSPSAPTARSSRWTWLVQRTWGPPAPTRWFPTSRDSAMPAFCTPRLPAARSPGSLLTGTLTTSSRSPLPHRWRAVRARCRG